MPRASEHGSASEGRALLVGLLLVTAALVAVAVAVVAGRSEGKAPGARSLAAHPSGSADAAADRGPASSALLEGAPDVPSETPDRADAPAVTRESVVTGDDRAPAVEEEPAPARHVLRGRVFTRVFTREDDEAPVEGARVRLFVGPAGSESAARVVTDEEGRFEARFAETGPVRLDVRHPDHADTGRGFAEWPGSEEELRIALAAPARVVVTVRGGALRPGVEARVALRRGRSIDGVAPDPSGEVVFEGVEPGEVDVLAWATDAEGRLLATATLRGVAVDSGEPCRLELDLPAPALVVGRVQGVGALPLGAEPGVLFRWRGERWPDELCRRLAWTTPLTGGAFEGPVPVGPSRVEFEPPGGRRFRQDVLPTGSGEVVEVEFALAPTTSLNGRVLDSAGDPAAATVILARRLSDAERLPRPDRLDHEGYFRSVAAEADGSFRFEEVPTHTKLHVVAVGPGAEEACPLGRALRLDWQGRPGREGNVILRLVETRAIRGTVVSTEGEPIADARVRLQARVGRTRVERFDERTDGQGEFEFDCVPLRGLELEVEHAAFHGNSRSVRRSELEERSGLEVELAPSAPLSGFVLDPEGYGVRTARVRAERVDTPGPRGRPERASARARDASGRFRFEHLTPGRWSLVAEARDCVAGPLATALVDVPDERPVLLELEPAARPARATVYGVVVASDGGPLERLRIDGRRGGILERDGERFSIEGILPGRMRLRFSAAGCVEVRPPALELQPGARVDLGEVVLDRSTRLVVRTVDAAGAPVSGARVRLQPLPPQQGGLAGARTLKLREERPGRHVLERAPRAAWRLRVSHARLASVRRRLVVQERVTQGVKIVLEPDG